MIKTGLSYLECDGCQRVLWKGEDRQVVIDLVLYHVCSQECGHKVIDAKLADLPKTSSEAEAKQVQDAAKHAEVEAIKKEHEERKQFVWATQQARAAVIKDELDRRAQATSEDKDKKS